MTNRWNFKFVDNQITKKKKNKITKYFLFIATIKKERTITPIPNKFSNKFTPFPIQQLSSNQPFDSPFQTVKQIETFFLPNNRQDDHDESQEREKKPDISTGRRMAYENSRDLVKGQGALMVIWIWSSLSKRVAGQPRPFNHHPNQSQLWSHEASAARPARLHVLGSFRPARRRLQPRWDWMERWRLRVGRSRSGRISRTDEWDFWSWRNDRESRWSSPWYTRARVPFTAVREPGNPSSDSPRPSAIQVHGSERAPRANVLACEEGGGGRGRSCAGRFNDGAREAGQVDVRAGDAAGRGAGVGGDAIHAGQAEHPGYRAGCENRRSYPRRLRQRHVRARDVGGFYKRWVSGRADFFPSFFFLCCFAIFWGVG